MADAGDICACLACSGLCGILCIAAAEEEQRDRQEQERMNTMKEQPLKHLDPIPVTTIPPSHPQQRVTTYSSSA